MPSADPDGPAADERWRAAKRRRRGPGPNGQRIAGLLDRDAHSQIARLVGRTDDVPARKREKNGEEARASVDERGLDFPGDDQRIGLYPDGVYEDGRGRNGYRGERTTGR